MKSFLFILICLFFLPSAMAVSPDVSYWSMNEGEGTVVEDSVSGNNGTLFGEVSWTTGKSSYGLEFDGDGDYVNISADSSLNLRANNEPHTVSLWFKINQLPSDKGVNFAIISQANGVGTGRSWIMVPTAAGTGYVADEIIGVGSSSVAVGSNVTAETNTWYFATFVYDGTDMIMYVNGIQGDTVTNSINESASGDIRIGVNKGVAGAWFNGTIDEVKLFDRNLSAAEIQELYSPSVVSGRVLSIRFRELGVSPQRIAVFYPNGSKQGDYDTSGVIKINTSLGSPGFIIHSSKMSMLGDPNQGFNLLEYHAGTLPSAAVVLGGVVVGFSILRRFVK